MTGIDIGHLSCFNSFAHLCPLYEGSNAVVYKCCCTTNLVQPPQLVVVKIVLQCPTQSREDYILAVSREYLNLRAAQSKHVISVILLEQSPEGPWALIMPYYPLGDLHACLVRLRKRRMDLLPSMKDYIFLQILRGVCHLHSIAIVHRDIKPANCLIDDNGVIKISDFGYSINTSVTSFAEQVRQLGVKYLCCGTTSFKAPELFAYEEKWPNMDVNVASTHLEAVDSWLLAILYIHLCTMTAPWSSCKDLVANFATYKSMYAQGSDKLLRSINDKLVLLLRLGSISLFRDLPYDSRPHILLLLNPNPQLRALPGIPLDSKWLKHAYADTHELVNLARER